MYNKYRYITLTFDISSLRFFLHHLCFSFLLVASNCVCFSLYVLILSYTCKHFDEKCRHLAASLSSPILSIRKLQYEFYLLLCRVSRSLSRRSSCYLHNTKNEKKEMKNVTDDIVLRKYLCLVCMCTYASLSPSPHLSQSLIHCRFACVRV